ncbi:probable RAP domain-containing protein, chloroplastic [Coccomyxa sp. Obi]|nr:probable RAP domain-containing protein, chloroplastic [Coccomyxa sp. Obi]
MENDLLVSSSRLRCPAFGTCGNPGPSNRCLLGPSGSWDHAYRTSKVLRDVPRERQGVLRARKGRSYGDEVPRQRHFWEATVQPKPAEEYKELLSNADDLVHAPAAITAELMECQDVTEILDIVSEEAAIMTGDNAALALMRLVNLSRSQLHRLRHGPGFHKLINTLEEHIDELGPKELAQTLWSLAKAKHSRPKLLRRLAERASSLVPDFNVRDLSTVIWAFGSLQYSPDKSLLDDIGAAALAHMDEFQPQGLSMLTWGYGKLDHIPAGDLLGQVAQRLETQISLYHHQAVANMFYSLGRLGQYSPSVCSAVEMHVTEHADDFSTQELMNILWAFVKFRFVPTDFIGMLLKSVQDEKRAHAFRASDWAALIWGLASLGVSVSAEAMAAINNAAMQTVPDMTAPELCNVIWGLSILDECREPLFAEGISQLLDKQQQRSLEPRLLRQLLQASALARAAGMPVSLPQALEKAAAKWWRTTANRVPSLSHDGVSRTLKNLGVKHKVLVFLLEGLPTVDIALEAGTDQQKVAIQVAGPHEVSANTGELLGRARAEARLLAANGWRPMHIVVSALSDPASQQTRSIVRQLQKEGLQVGAPHGGNHVVPDLPRGRAPGQRSDPLLTSSSLSSLGTVQLDREMTAFRLPKGPDAAAPAWPEGRLRVAASGQSLMSSVSRY